MKSSFRFFLGLIFAIIILGLSSLQNEVLILAIPLMVYVFAAIFERPEAINLLVTREISTDRTFQGTPVNVRLTVMNCGAAITELSVTDVLPDGVVLIDGRTAATAFLPASGELELTYTIEAQRGKYDDYETIVYTREFLNFFQRALVYRTTPRLLIHPRYPKLNRIKIRPPQTRGFAGPIAARQGGTGVNFWGVREYQSSDPQRQINWKLTARSERDLYANVFEQERVADVGLILDARERTNLTTSSDSIFEHAVRAAASLAENFLDDGNRVSLLIYGSALVRVFPGYGRVQRDRILRELSQAEPGMNYALESLNHLPTRLFPAKSQVVMVSPLVFEDIPTIVRMRAQGYAVMIISPDPVSYEAARYQDTASPAYRLAYAERNLMLRQVRRCGAQIVNWQVDQPLENVIREMLAQQPLIIRNYRMRM